MRRWEPGWAWNVRKDLGPVEGKAGVRSGAGSRGLGRAWLAAGPEAEQRQSDLEPLLSVGCPEVSTAEQGFKMTKPVAAV